MICGNQNITFKTLKACDNCPQFKEGNSYHLRDQIPEGHCYELIHSLLPYLTTFEKGGWFKWERTRDRVIVSCPSVKDNVCVELRRLTVEKPHRFEYNILNVKGNCAYYKPGVSRQINTVDFKNLCRDLFNVLFPYIKAENNGIALTCGRSKGQSQFALLKNEGK